MNIQYLNTNYTFNTQFIKNKYKNKLISIFTDKHLKDHVYVLNSGLLTNSFLTKKQVLHNKNIKNTHLVSKVLNKWGLFYLYPIKEYKNLIVNERHSYNFLQKHFNNKNLVINSYKNGLNLKKINNFVNKIIKNNCSKKTPFIISSLYKLFQNSTRLNPLELLIINKVIRKYKKINYYFDFKGGVFTIKKKIIKKLIPFYLFKKKLKQNYKKNIKAILSLNNFYKREDLHYFLKGKIYLYINYCLYTSKNVVLTAKRMKVKKKYTIFGKKFYQTKPDLIYFENYLKSFKNIPFDSYNIIKNNRYYLLKYNYSNLNLYYLYNKLNFYVFDVKYLLFFDYYKIITNENIIIKKAHCNKNFINIITKLGNKKSIVKPFYFYWKSQFKWSSGYLKLNQKYKYNN